MDKVVTPVAEGTQLQVRVVPRAGRNAIVGVQGGRLKVRLTAPPVEGAANTALIEFLARTLDIPRRDVRLVSGERGRNKVVLVCTLTPAEVCQRLGL